MNAVGEVDGQRFTETLGGEQIWNIHGRTRRDWHNVAHVLESFLQHGGDRADKAFRAYFRSTGTQRKKNLAHLTHVARDTFERL